MCVDFVGGRLGGAKMKLIEARDVNLLSCVQPYFVEVTRTVGALVETMISTSTKVVGATKAFWSIVMPGAT